MKCRLVAISSSDHIGALHAAESRRRRIVYRPADEPSAGLPTERRRPKAARANLGRDMVFSDVVPALECLIDTDGTH